jgi:hypothetical protein
MSGQDLVIRYIKDPTNCWYFFRNSGFGTLSEVVNMKPFSNGVLKVLLLVQENLLTRSISRDLHPEKLGHFALVTTFPFGRKL